MIKKVSLIVLVISMSLYSIALFSGFTGFVIPLSVYEIPDHKLVSGDKISPLKSFDFDSGEWVVYLSINQEDFATLPATIPKAIGFKTTDTSLLKRAQETWHFTYTGSDMATVMSTIYFFKDGKLMFESGIAISQVIEGLQSREFGWVKAGERNAISNFVRYFDRIYWPIVIL